MCYAVLQHSIPRIALHCTAKNFSKFFRDTFSQRAIAFAGKNLLRCNANGERLRAGEEYQVLYYIGFDNGDMDVRRVREIRIELSGSWNKNRTARFRASKQ